MSPKELSAKLEAASSRLEAVERKRMPGGYALFTAGKIFANVTVDGRIGVKLTEPWCFQELAALPGAGQWTLGKKTMEHWVLLPETLAANDATLKVWVERAYACAVGKPPQKPPIEFDADPPPTARSQHDVNGSVFARARLKSVPDVVEVQHTTPPLTPRSRRSLVPAPPSSGRAAIDLASYAPPPPSSVGIRLVPKDSKSPYEETLVGVPAPPSSRVDLDDDD